MYQAETLDGGNPDTAEVGRQKIGRIYGEPWLQDNVAPSRIEIRHEQKISHVWPDIDQLFGVSGLTALDEFLDLFLRYHRLHMRPIGFGIERFQGPRRTRQLLGLLDGLDNCILLVATGGSDIYDRGLVRSFVPEMAIGGYEFIRVISINGHHELGSHKSSVSSDFLKRRPEIPNLPRFHPPVTSWPNP